MLRGILIFSAASAALIVRLRVIDYCWGAAYRYRARRPRRGRSMPRYCLQRLNPLRFFPTASYTVVKVRYMTLHRTESMARLGAGGIPRTRCIPEYAIEWPARAESDEKLTSVVKPAPRGTGAGGRVPWRASTDFCTSCTRKLRLAPERAMLECKMAGEYWRKSACSTGGK